MTAPPTETGPPTERPAESTLTLLARRASHYLYDRRSRARLGRTPEVPFPGLHESLATHLAAVLPPRLLARVSLPTYLAWTGRLTRVVTRTGHAASVTVLAVRAVFRRAPAETDPCRPDG